MQLLSRHAREVLSHQHTMPEGIGPRKEVREISITPNLVQAISG